MQTSSVCLLYLNDFPLFFVSHLGCCCRKTGTSGHKEHNSLKYSDLNARSVCVFFFFFAHILSIFLFPSVFVSVSDRARVDFNREAQKRLKSTAAREKKKCGDSRH